MKCLYLQLLYNAIIGLLCYKFDTLFEKFDVFNLMYENWFETNNFDWAAYCLVANYLKSDMTLHRYTLTLYIVSCFLGSIIFTSFWCIREKFEKFLTLEFVLSYFFLDPHTLIRKRRRLDDIYRCLEVKLFWQLWVLWDMLQATQLWLF